MSLGFASSSDINLHHSWELNSPVKGNLPIQYRYLASIGPNRIVGIQRNLEVESTAPGLKATGQELIQHPSRQQVEVRAFLSDPRELRYVLLTTPTEQFINFDLQGYLETLGTENSLDAATRGPNIPPGELFSIFAKTEETESHSFPQLVIAHQKLFPYFTEDELPSCHQWELTEGRLKDGNLETSRRVLIGRLGEIFTPKQGDEETHTFIADEGKTNLVSPEIGVITRSNEGLKATSDRVRVFINRKDQRDVFQVTQREGLLAIGHRTNSFDAGQIVRVSSWSLLPRQIGFSSIFPLAEKPKRLAELLRIREVE